MRGLSHSGGGDVTGPHPHVERCDTDDGVRYLFDCPSCGEHVEGFKTKKHAEQYRDNHCCPQSPDPR